MKDFAWALHAMKDGRLVTRKNWNDPALCISIEGNAIEIRYPAGGPASSSRVDNVGFNDIVATDWELAYSEGVEYQAAA